MERVIGLDLEWGFYSGSYVDLIWRFFDPVS
jgi:hypothetical protein